jgi:phosphate-selective porin
LLPSVSAGQLGNGTGTGIDGIIGAVEIDHMILQVHVDDRTSMMLNGQFQSVQKSGFIHDYLLIITIVDPEST